MVSDLISRQDAINYIDAVFPVDPMKSEYAQGIACGAALAKTYIKQLPPAEPETHEKRTETHACDLISRQATIMHFVKASKSYECGMFNLKELTHELWQLPPAQPEITECPMCHDCPDNCPLEVEHDNK